VAAQPLPHRKETQLRQLRTFSRPSLPAVHITLSLPRGEQKSTIRRVNYWNIIADTLDSLNKARLWNSRNLSAPPKDAY
jgi:hypothetical protein